MNRLKATRSAFAWLLLFGLVLAGATAAYAQATGGTVSGVVTDQTGASVPGAKITVRNLDTNASRTATTEADGRYSFPGLPVGNYELKIELAGFATYVRGPIVLNVNQNAIIDAVVRPAAVAEVVTVTEDAPILNTTNAEVGVRFDERRITDLPTSGQFGSGGGFRDVFAFALSAPGVSQTNSGNSAFTAGTNFSVNGMRLRGNNFMVDGQDSNDPSVAGRQQVINNPDIIKEFRLITNQFDAEFGRSAGAVVNVVTKSGTNDFHGTAFWFYNSNALNSRSNLDKAAGYREAPFLNEHQFGGTFGGPIVRDKMFFFGSYQKWTIRALGSGTTINGVPTEAGRQLLQSTVGSRAHVAALLANLPAAQTPIANAIAAYCITAGTLPACTGGTRVNIPLGSLTNSTSNTFDDTQWSVRFDHQINSQHSYGGRFLYDDGTTAGGGQVTPPGLTSDNLARRLALTTFLTSNLTSRTLNEFRASWQRLASNTISPGAPDPPIPSVEVPEFGLTGFNAATSRTAIGLAVNLPQFRFNDTYQIQDTFSWTSGAHALKFGADLRRVDVNSFFFPTIRGRLNYPTVQPPTDPVTWPVGTVSIQSFIDDIASVTDINRALPGGEAIVFYKWYDYYFFAQDTWRVHPTFSLNYGVRYETPGNAVDSLVKLNERIVAANGGGSVFQLTPVPKRDKNNWQPRVGFSWNPHTSNGGPIGWLTGGDKLVLRGGYSRTNDYAFINIALNVASSFPFVAAISSPGANAWTRLPTLQPDLSSPAALQLLTRTVVADDFRAPIAEQFSMELQRALTENLALRVGYVGTKGTALFQTLDGNPRTLCNPIPATRNAQGVWSVGQTDATRCPRVDPLRGVIRLRANAASSIYHSMQVQLDRRFSKGFSAGMHYTWSAFIDTASEVFNPSARGEVALSQNSFNRVKDRARSTYDRPHRLSSNFVWELPFYRTQQGWLGHVAGGWQVSGFVTFQSGSPWSALNGSDPTNALSGISGLVGDPVRPNINTTQDLSSMSVEELLLAGGRSLFSSLVVLTGSPAGSTNCTLNAGSTTAGTCVIPIANRFGNLGRNVLRSDGIGQIDFGILKTTRITESHKMQFRVDFFNMTNTRNFGIPEARISSAAFGNQWSTDGGNRRIFMSLKYMF